MCGMFVCTFSLSVARSVTDCDLENVRLHPRFGIEQGIKADGSVKVRPVDHYSWHAGHHHSKRRRKAASVNGHCLLTEKLSHDHVDDIVDGMASLQRQAAGIRLQAGCACAVLIYA